MKRPTATTMAFVAMLTLGALGMLFALMRDPSHAWMCAIGNAGIFALGLWTERSEP